MGTHRVSAHRRRAASGKMVEVQQHQRSRLDLLRHNRKTAAQKRRQRRGRSGAWFQPRRAGNRLRRAWDAARKRKKALAVVLALGGVVEIGGFMAARGIGVVAMGAAIVLTVAASAALAASSSPDNEPKQRLSPRGGPVSQKAKKKEKKKEKGAGAGSNGSASARSRRADGAPETDAELIR